MAKDDLKTIDSNDVENGDIVELFETIVEEKNFSMIINFAYQINPKQKQLIKLTKIPDPYSVAMNKDILVQFNGEYFDFIEDDDMRKILFEQEIDKIETNIEKNTIKIGKHTVSTNLGIVNKWTFDKVQNAIEIESHLDEIISEKKGE